MRDIGYKDGSAVAKLGYEASAFVFSNVKEGEILRAIMDENQHTQRGELISYHHKVNSVGSIDDKTFGHLFLVYG